MTDLISQSTKKKKKKKTKGNFAEEFKSMPDHKEGVFIRHADSDKMAPKDYLLIARVVKRRVRPLTVAEHAQREKSVAREKVLEDMKT